jgi:N-acetylmuramate 1-kinase
MESLDELKNAERQKALEHWLQSTPGLASFTLQPMQGDASFRRYFRIKTASCSLVAMDAPPPRENCRPFVAIAKSLRALGLNAPDIMAADLAQGFLLITDFGDRTYLKALTPENADHLYGLALHALATLQGCKEVNDYSVPPFTEALMRQEWAWHKEWFLGKLLGLTLSSTEEKQLGQCMDLIVDSALSQPQVFMHRDYHSANLMVTADENIALLDFQDAFIGPVTYDLVSLLRDCYIDWPPQQVQTWALLYRQQLLDKGVLRDVDEQTFLQWFDWMGLQRHLKALFTFARKHVRDQQSQYLQSIPRTLHYLQSVSLRYTQMAALHDYLSQVVQPTFLQASLCEP